jgi:hypothetical protein
MLLVEPEQPTKSIFSIGNTRHNAFMPDGPRFNPVHSGLKLTEKPTRIIEWIEN